MRGLIQLRLLYRRVAVPLLPSPRLLLCAAAARRSFAREAVSRVPPRRQSPASSLPYSAA